MKANRPLPEGTKIGTYWVGVLNNGDWATSSDTKENLEKDMEDLGYKTNDYKPRCRAIIVDIEYGDYYDDPVEGLGETEEEAIANFNKQYNN